MQQFKSHLRSASFHFDIKKLRSVCNAPSSEFSKYGTRVDLPEPTSKWQRISLDGRFYFFKDNGSDILAVAHLDSVQSKRFCTLSHEHPKGKRGGHKASRAVIKSPSLDDRLGAYTICELLPSMGFKFNILLTTDEECGASTASEFEPENHGQAFGHYKWMFQFDRGGQDAVCYQYECADLVDAIESAGIEVGYGSYSDISSLSHIGCRGINFGVAYQDYHSRSAFAYLNEYLACVARFAVFYKANENTSFDYEEPKWERGGSAYDEYDLDARYDYPSTEQFENEQRLLDQWHRDDMRQARKDGKRVFSDRELQTMFFSLGELPDAGSMIWDMISVADLNQLAVMVNDDINQFEQGSDIQKEYMKFVKSMPNFDLLHHLINLAGTGGVTAITGPGSIGYLASLFQMEQDKKNEKPFGFEGVREFKPESQIQIDSEPYGSQIEPHGGLIEPEIDESDV